MDNTILESLLTYGSLGVVTAYFMIKDWQLNSKLQDALNEFTVAINAIIKKEV